MPHAQRSIAKLRNEAARRGVEQQAIIQEASVSLAIRVDMVIQASRGKGIRNFP